MAGDDVDQKKPDPMIYRIAAERLSVDPKECLVVEDSTIGLQVTSHAALCCKARGMPAHAVLTEGMMQEQRGAVSIGTGQLSANKFC